MSGRTHGKSGNYLLAIDIGNTNITAGLFREGRLCRRMKISTHAYSTYAKSIKGLLKRVPENGRANIIVSSVVPLALSRLVMSLNRIGAGRIVVLGRDFKVPVTNLYRIRSEVGTDRLVNAFAAKAIYGTPSVVVDFGTAITFDCISKEGDYLGGLILPGIAMSLSGLHKKTALLPRVELKRARNIIGKDTVNSIRGGILFGFGKMCDGLVSEYRKMLGSRLKVIATGGNARLISGYSKSVRFVDEDLTLKGLYLISGSFFKFFC
jgi:type III pantothenate kinase